VASPAGTGGVNQAAAGSGGSSPAAAPADAPAAAAAGAPAGAPASGCAVEACVTIDATSPVGAFSHPGAGINVVPTGTLDPSVLSRLGTTMYRSSPPQESDGLYDCTEMNEAAAAGARTTLILSNLWYNQGHGGFPPTPWSNWNAYDSWVRQTVATLQVSGCSIDFWDVYNEPGWDNYYSASDFAAETPGDLLEQFLHTYDDIKAVEPSAAIVGPSIGDMVFSPLPANFPFTHEPDFTTFLQFCAANHLTLAAVAWHQNGTTPAQLDQLVAQAEAVVRSLPSLGDPPMFIDEYADPAIQPLPGWDVGYLSVLARNDISYSVRSCWDGCSASTLDGLLLDGGTQYSSEYWERIDYASMTGNQLTATANAPDLSVLAAGSWNRVQALVGRMAGCATPAWCAQYQSGAFPQVGPEPVQVSVTVPWSAPSVQVNVSWLPPQPGQPLSAPVPASVAGLRLAPDGPGREVVSFSFPSFADGGAYFLTVTPGS
jgi:hypothetical protein